MRIFRIPITVKISATYEVEVAAPNLEEAITEVEQLEISDIVDHDEFVDNADLHDIWVDRKAIEEA